MCNNKDIEKIVINICEDIAEKLNDKRYEYSYETKIERKNGLDSLTMMNIFIEFGSYFGVDLDDVLLELGKAKTIGELAGVLDRKGNVLNI